MDYKYIEQLLDRYWACETTLEEEAILRAFFSQAEVPASLSQWKPLFASMTEEPKTVVLDESFDERVLAQIGETEEKRPRTATLQARLMPLFKSAAVVAIFLSLGNALQMAFEPQPAPQQGTAFIQKLQEGPAMAKADTLKTDTLKAAVAMQPIIK